MKYETFKQTILQRLERDIPDPKKISIQAVSKNNGLLLDGLIIMENGCNISPTLYLNYYFDSYEAGTPFQDVYEALLHNYRENRPQQSIDIRFFTEFENIRPKIAFRIINRKRNEKILRDIPHMDFLDLSIVFYCVISMDIRAGSATILIHNSHLEYWHITPARLFEVARENTPQLLPYCLRSMNDVLQDLARQQKILPPDPPRSGMYPMFVLTNHRNHYGACCMLYRNLLKDFSAQTGTDFYILPSSVHEVILIPAMEENCMEELSAMVREVNETQLAAEEILADHAYYYSAQKNDILMHF